MDNTIRNWLPISIIVKKYTYSLTYRPIIPELGQDDKKLTGTPIQQGKLEVLYVLVTPQVHSSPNWHPPSLFPIPYSIHLHSSPSQLFFLHSSFHYLKKKMLNLNLLLFPALPSWDLSFKAAKSLVPLTAVSSIQRRCSYLQNE